MKQPRKDLLEKIKMLKNVWFTSTEVFIALKVSRERALVKMSLGLYKKKHDGWLDKLCNKESKEKQFLGRVTILRNVLYFLYSENISKFVCAHL